MKRFLPLAFLCCAAAQAALDFTTSGANVNYGSGAGLDMGTAQAGNTISIVVWLRLNSLATAGIVWDKSDAGFTTERFFGYQNTSGLVNIEIGRATTFARGQANSNALTTGTWHCIAATWDGGDVNGPRVYIGDLTTPLVEVSYSTRTAGSGAIHDDSSNDLRTGKAAGFGQTQGSIALVHYIKGTELTLEQLRAQQFRPHVLANTKLFSVTGWNGTGTQADWSGCTDTGCPNNGTVTSATVADHVPLGSLFALFRLDLRRWWEDRALRAILNSATTVRF
jgi:hypothetical protein